MEKKELWYEMLTTYRNRLKYENGITLPNMIGAYYHYDNTIDLSSSQCVVRVLNDILASPQDVGVLINKCCNINNYVLSLLEETHLGHPNLNGRIFINLYDLDLKNHISSIDELGEYLYTLHRKEIVDRKFSVTDGIWNPLSHIETGHIHDIIKSLHQ